MFFCIVISFVTSILKCSIGHNSCIASNGGPPNRPLPPTPDEEEMIDRERTLVMRRVSTYIIVFPRSFLLPIWCWYKGT